MIAAGTTQFWRSRQRSRRPAAFFAALVVYIIVILVAAPSAQQQQQAYSPSVGPSTPTIRDASDGSDIDLLVGRSTLLNVGSTIARVSLTVPDVADAMVTTPTQLLIHGKQPGTISLFVWDKGGAIKTFEVKVRRDLNTLKEQLRMLFPAEEITVLGNGKDVVISGTVASKYVVEKAADVASGYVDKKENVVNLLKQQEGVASNQVMLRVRFAEVSRSAMQELGATFFANGYKSEWFGRTQPPGVPGPTFDDGKLIFSDFLNLFLFNSKEGLGGAIRALQNKGLFQSLAEPNLIATNGKEASFLAGGEYPYPIVQPAGTGGSSVTIQFKEFGIRLNFTPTVLGGDLIHLKVRPEVSALDFSNAVELEGFRIPALSTRRTETEIELRDGQTFAIAGLMNNTLTQNLGRIPGIGDIPILGYLFRSRQYQKNQTELVVMITPSIIRRGQMGASEGLPSLVEPYLGPPSKTYPNPDPHTGSPRYPVNQGKQGGDNNPAPAPAPAPAPSASAPVPSRPIAQQPAVPAQSKPQTPASAMPMTPSSSSSTTTPSQGVQGATAPTPVQMSAPQTTTMTPALTKDQEKALAKARTQEQEAAGKRNVEAQKKAEADKRQADRIAKERAKREAEIAKKNAELERKKAEEDQKRGKALNDAASRLKEAQSAYQQELEKAKGGSGDNKKSGSPSGARQ
jgi:pilus assembly protein CpaC